MRYVYLVDVRRNEYDDLVGEEKRTGVTWYQDSHGDRTWTNGRETVQPFQVSTSDKNDER